MKQYIVKYNHHSGDFGIYDSAAQSITWGMDKAESTSRAARCNAVNAIGASINAAIAAISTVLSGPLSALDRAELRLMREELRTMRAEVPTAEALAHALAREAADAAEVA